MDTDKEKINYILREFQKLLKIHKPNSSELEIITSKINKMTSKNLQKARKKSQTRSTTSEFEENKPKSSPSIDKNWYKIDIE